EDEQVPDGVGPPRAGLRRDGLRRRGLRRRDRSRDVDPGPRGPRGGGLRPVGLPRERAHAFWSSRRMTAVAAIVAGVGARGTGTSTGSWMESWMNRFGVTPPRVAVTFGVGSPTPAAANWAVTSAVALAIGSPGLSVTAPARTASWAACVAIDCSMNRK